MTEITRAHRIFSNGICSPVSCSRCHGIRRALHPVPVRSLVCAIPPKRRVISFRTKSRSGKGEKEEERRRENRSANTKFRAARVVWEQFSHQIECAALGMSSSPRSTQEGASLKNVDGEIVIRLPTFFSFFLFLFCDGWDPFSVSLWQRECCSRAPHPIDIAVALPRRFFGRGRQGLSRNISHNY